jgi:AraC-like DNA-binding protein
VSSPGAALDCRQPQPDTPSRAQPPVFRKARRLSPRSPGLRATTTGVSLRSPLSIVHDRFCHISSHLNYAMSLFRRHYRITLKTYLTRLRACQAQYLLTSTERGISEMAFQTGFGFISRFYEAFKAVGRTTPDDIDRCPGSADVAGADSGRGMSRHAGGPHPRRLVEGCRVW